MNLFFFTAADHNPKYRREAEILIASGKAFGREIHFFEIPADETWNRYKPKLLASKDLPAADKYIYMDSDTILTCRGDWESPECQGVSDIMYLWPEQRIKHTQGFIRNHTLLAGDAQVCEFITDLWRAMRFPIWPNSGVVVLNAADRIPFAELWLAWLDLIDKQSAKGQVVGDEAACMFARYVYNLPLLPACFNGLCKWQPIHDWHQLIHADGNVTGEKRLPYIQAIEKILPDMKDLP